MSPEEKKWCPKCGRRVEAISVSFGTEGIGRLRCSNCGSFLDEGEDFSSFREALLEQDEQVTFSDESIVIPTYDQVLVVGYKHSIRELIIDEVTRKNLARETISCENGEDMIIKIVESLNSKESDRINLVMLDIPMPYLNGINAALGMRAIEKTYLGHKLIPILFFTQKPIDDSFKKVIKYLSPAKYAGLGQSENPKELAPRISRVVSLLAQESW